MPNRGITNRYKQTNKQTHNKQTKATRRPKQKMLILKTKHENATKRWFC